jgi:hypothetical protein
MGWAWDGDRADGVLQAITDGVEDHGIAEQGREPQIRTNDVFIKRWA